MRKEKKELYNKEISLFIKNRIIEIGGYNVYECHRIMINYVSYTYPNLSKSKIKKYVREIENDINFIEEFKY